MTTFPVGDGRNPGVRSSRAVYRPIGGTGSYAATGNVLKFSALTLSLQADGGTAEGPPVEEFGYCVSGNTLTLGPGSVDGSGITLTR